MNSFVHIWCGQHGLWWREGGHGYTDRKEEAGVFKADEVRYLTGESYADKMNKLVPATPEYEI